MRLPANTYLISTEFWGRKLNLAILRGDYLFLIDTGLAGMPESLIFPYMADRVLEKEDLHLFASTHAHADHMGGNAEIQAACPSARLGCHELDRPWIESHELHYVEAYKPWIERGVAGPELRQLILDVCGADSPADLAWAGGEKIDLGDRRIEVIHAPGHTPGNLVFLDRDQGILFEGETILGNSSGEPNKKGMPYYCDVVNYRHTLHHLAALPWDILVSSHAAPRTRAAGLAAIQTSLDHVEQVHGQVIEALSALRAPATALDVARAISARHGWAMDIGLGAVTERHLEYLERTKQAARLTDGRWEWQG